MKDAVNKTIAQEPKLEQALSGAKKEFSEYANTFLDNKQLSGIRRTLDPNDTREFRDLVPTMMFGANTGEQFGTFLKNAHSKYGKASDDLGSLAGDTIVDQLNQQLQNATKYGTPQEQVQALMALRKQLSAADNFAKGAGVPSNRLDLLARSINQQGGEALGKLGVAGYGTTKDEIMGVLASKHPELAIKELSDLPAEQRAVALQQLESMGQASPDVAAAVESAARGNVVPTGKTAGAQVASAVEQLENPILQKSVGQADLTNMQMGDEALRRAEEFGSLRPGEGQNARDAARLISGSAGLAGVRGGSIFNVLTGGANLGRSLFGITEPRAAMSASAKNLNAAYQANPDPSTVLTAYGVPTARNLSVLPVQGAVTSQYEALKRSENTPPDEAQLEQSLADEDIIAELKRMEAAQAAPTTGGEYEPSEAEILEELARQTKE